MPGPFGTSGNPDPERRSAVGRQARPQHDGEAVAGVVELEAGARGPRTGWWRRGRAWGSVSRGGGSGRREGLKRRSARTGDLSGHSAR